MTPSVLYDAQGPIARRRTVVVSVVAGAAVLVVVALVVRQLARQGQFGAALWGPLTDPNDESFAPVWRLLGSGLVLTAQAAVVSALLSLVLGTAIGVARISAGRVTRVPIVVVVELLRGLPVVISIYFASRVLPSLGVELANLWYLVLGLTAYNCVIIAEIVRSGVASLPRGQREAGMALGLTAWQTMRIILLPQGFRVMLPSLISQLVVIVKDTSLAAVVLNGFPEVMNQAKTIYLNLRNPLQVYLVVGLLFVVVNYLLSRLAVFVERRLSRSRQPSRGGVGGSGGHPWTAAVRGASTTGAQSDAAPPGIGPGGTGGGA